MTNVYTANQNFPGDFFSRSYSKWSPASIVIWKVSYDLVISMKWWEIVAYLIFSAIGGKILMNFFHQIFQGFLFFNEVKHMFMKYDRWVYNQVIQTMESVWLTFHIPYSFRLELLCLLWLTPEDWSQWACCVRTDKRHQFAKQFSATHTILRLKVSPRKHLKFTP